MSREEVRKLLGGYATGTLTPAEQEALFAAALEDQELFEALAKEQPVAEVLQDPTARAELLRALDAGAERPAWWRWRPMIAAVAMAGVALVAVAVWRGSREKAPVMVAEMRKDEGRAAAPAAAPAAALPKAAPPVQAPAPAFRAPVKAPAKKAEANEAAPVLKDAAVDALKEKKVEAAAAPARARVRAEAENSAVATMSGQLVQPQVVMPLVPPAGGAGVGGAVRDQVVTLAAPMMAKASAPAPLLRWGIVRGGAEVPNDTVLEAGDTVQLRITAVDDGTVEVYEGERLVQSAAVSKGVAFDTAPILFAGAGPRELRLRLVRGARVSEVRVGLRYR